MNNNNFYVLIGSDILGLNTNFNILGIYDHASGTDRIQQMMQNHSDKKYELRGPFKLNTSDNSDYLMPKPQPMFPPSFPPLHNEMIPKPIVPPLQPDITRSPHPDIFPKDFNTL
jgi:hypothetical protein